MQCLKTSQHSSFAGITFGIVMLTLFLPWRVAAEQFSALSGQPNTLTLRSFKVEAQPDQHIVVECGLGVSDARSVRALLRDGAVINLTCKLVIERLRTLLANETLVDITEVHQLRHDPLTREFIMLAPNAPARRDKKLDALLAATWEVMTFNAPLQTPLASGETYKVRLDVTLQHAEVPQWLEKALFFWSWDIAPAASFTQEFTY